MSTRYEIAPDWVKTMVTDTVHEHFNFMEARGVRILPLFDLQKRVSQARIVFGRFAKAKDEMNVLASLAERDPYDYALYLDKVLFMRMEAADRVRLIAHELSHALGKATADGDLKWGIRGHDYEMFAWEIKDPAWQKTSARWAEMAAALYDSDAPLPAELPPTPQDDYLAILEGLRKQGVRITVTE